MSRLIIHDHNDDGVDRRGFLECMDGFQYSDSLKKAKGVWKEDTLERWLGDTEKLVPTTT